MIYLYLFCLIPLIGWLAVWMKREEIVVGEILVSTGYSLVIAVVVHIVSYRSQIGDKEYWSGQIVSVQRESAWREKYEEAQYRTEYYNSTESYTDSKGKSRTRSVRKSRRVFSHWEWRTRWHERRNVAISNIGTDYVIGDHQYNKFKEKFGLEQSEKGDRRSGERSSHMIDGDPNDYYLVNNNNVIIPVTKEVRFENRLRTNNSLFSRTPDENKVSLPEIPENSDPFQSNRLVGTAKESFSIKALDVLNAKLGPHKQVDIVICGFDSSDIMLSYYLEDKWRGGTKNGLYICYGDGWARTFGWSKSDVCKKNIDAIFLKEKSDALLDEVEQEIIENYQRRDWHDFDYVPVEPTGTAWLWFLILMIAGQTGIFVYCLNNDVTKNNANFFTK